VVKFEANGSYGVRVKGGLAAQGSSAPGGRVTFTSIRDDLAAGNTDGAGGSPSAGSWDALHIDATDGSAAINLAYADLRYGGNSCCTGALVGNSSPTGTLSVTHSNFESSNYYAIRLNNYRDSVSFTCSDNTRSGNYRNGVLLGSLAVGVATLGPCTADLPYVVSGTLEVPVGGVFNLEPGTVVKFEANGSYGVRVKGGLAAQGSSAPGGRVTFTSIRDDLAAGDTDGAGGSPSAGSWDALHIDATDGSAAINLAYADLRYGGNSCCTGALVGNSSPTGTLILSRVVLALSNSGGARFASIGCNMQKCRVTGTALVQMGGTGHGIRNDASGSEVDGRYNWWGHSSGPSEGGTPPCDPMPRPAGSGFKVTCDVLFDPFLGTFPCGVNPLDPIAIPERIDGQFSGSDDDNDGSIDEPLPASSNVLDCDGDGFVGIAEAAIFPPPAENRDQDPCGTNAWPLDFVSGTVFNSTNQVDLPDLSSYVVPVRRIGTSPGDTGFDVRWDIVPGLGGPFGKYINLADLQKMTMSRPPMLGGELAFNGPACPWPP